MYFIRDKTDAFFVGAFIGGILGILIHGWLTGTLFA